SSGSASWSPGRAAPPMARSNRNPTHPTTNASAIATTIRTTRNTDLVNHARSTGVPAARRLRTPRHHPKPQRLERGGAVSGELVGHDRVGAHRDAGHRELDPVRAMSRAGHHGELDDRD